MATKDTIFCGEISKIIASFFDGENDNYKKIKSALVELLLQDQSLKGDLAHALCYFNSNDTLISSPSGIEKNLVSFSDHLVKSGLVSASKISPRTIANFINRKNDHPEEEGILALCFLFLVGQACLSPQHFDKENGHRVIREIGQLRELVVAFANCIQAPEDDPILLLVDKIGEYQSRRRLRASITSVFGGFFEKGDFDSSSLWPTVFGQPEPDANLDQWSDRISKQRNFLLYRFASTPHKDGKPRLIKSFLVLQSPGLNRAHFVAKIFTTGPHGTRRVSIGAPIPLGDTVSIMCTTKVESPFKVDDGVNNQLEPKAFRGLKCLSLHEYGFVARNGFTLGSLMTINKDDAPLFANVLLVKTDKNTDKEVEVDVIKASDLVDDIKKHSAIAKPLQKQNMLEIFCERALAALENASKKEALLGLSKAEAQSKLT